MITNSAAIGYALIAAKKLGFKQEELNQLEYMLKELIDVVVSEEEAEEVYRKN